MSLLMAALGAATINLPPSVVTAKKEESPHLASHYSSEVVSGKTLHAENHLDDLKISGLTSAGGTSRGRYFQMRGIGERSSYAAMPNESVAVLLDNVDYTGVGGILGTTGLNHIEVYKGPQNTLIGPSALAGMIVAQSKTAHEDSFAVIAEKSSYDAHLLALEKGITAGTAKVYLSGSHQKSDGHIKNSYLAREDTNQVNELSLKVKVELSTLTFNLHFFDFNNGYDVFNLENSAVTKSDRPGVDNQQTLGSSVSHIQNWDAVKLESIISGHQTKTLYSYDEDWGNNPDWLEYPGWNNLYDYNIEFTHDIKTLSIEERLSSGHGRFFHRTGVYFKYFADQARELAFEDGLVRKDIESRFKRHRYSIYQETQYQLSSDTSLFVGARIEQVQSDYQDNQANNYNPSELLWGARLGLSHEYSEIHDFTASIAKGFKPGGVNIGSNITNSRRLFNEEELYTLSLKLTGKTTPVRYDAEIFYSLRRQVQVETSYQDDPTDPSSFTLYTDNGTNGSSYGGELTVAWENSTFWNSEIQSDLNISRYGSYIYGTRNLRGRNYSYAPEYSLALVNTFILGQNWTLAINHRYQDNYYFGNSHDEQAPKSLITGASLEYQNDSWRFSLWGKNIFDERSERRGFFFGNRPPNFDSERFVQVGTPAIYGLRVQKSF